MSSASTQIVASRQMGLYEPFQHLGMWKDIFSTDNSLYVGASSIVDVDVKPENKFQFVSNESMEPSEDEDANRAADKVKRRLAQNREAARKSRLRKKAYVQQLEKSRIKLVQLEQELERAKQGVSLGYSGAVNTGIMAFEMEYGHWVEEQHRQTGELRNALQAHVSVVELGILVDNGLKHFNSLFRMKADVAKADVFYLLSGVWRSRAECLFLWIGGFRPSELLNVLLPKIEPLSEEQHANVINLQQSSQQAEEALSQGIDKLQQTLALSITSDSLSEETCESQMAAAVEKLETLESFVNQADHLRWQTVQRMSCILTTHQAARGLLAFGEFFQRLRAISSLWAARPLEPT